jgi:uncharacterized protein YbbK (DUF523 family)
MTILISACLLGINCRYDGGSNTQPDWLEALQGHQLVPICPEQLGGLTTPRAPVEILSEEPLCVHTKTGGDVTEAFLKGAEESLKLGVLTGATCAVLKERSPSCGVNMIYDGTFENVRIPGMGLTARALKDAGLEIYSEEELDRFLQENTKQY